MNNQHHPDLDKIKNLLEKVQALAERGIEGEREAAIPGSYSALAAQYGGKSLCNPIALQQREAASTPPGAQGHLVQAHRELEAWRPWPNLIGGLVALSFALPWFWYFVLRRVGELRHAVIGK